MVVNASGLSHYWFEKAGPAGELLDVLVVSGTFDLSADGQPVPLAAEQEACALHDEFAGVVGTKLHRAVMVRDSDLVPYKPATDILVQGHAHVPDGRLSDAWVAGVRIGPVRKLLRLHGPRQFRRRWPGWRLDGTEVIHSLMLDYRLAYGGCIDIPAELQVDDQAEVIGYPGNPAGLAWLPGPATLASLRKPLRRYVQSIAANLQEMPAPQIEAADMAVHQPDQAVATQGLGPWPVGGGRVPTILPRTPVTAVTR
nr:DUF2169 domain-containing protein [Chitinimonas arctica]